MINLSFRLRVQIDLIDFRSRPDNESKWILHARDCFSEYSWAYALKSKRAAEVASHLFDQFCSFGPPRILQSDNGSRSCQTVRGDLDSRITRIHQMAKSGRRENGMFLQRQLQNKEVLLQRCKNSLQHQVPSSP
ncbi:SCAN domain-containing protein 3-like [Littorina saxatilis]|uniref:SCAN domain-containing protein 3-like n=1 Tax=Littorina saxatilis TaxID=31220 RepID=UPI0038B4CCDB